MIDTDTRLLRPAEITEEALKNLDEQAADLVRAYSGRHRLNEDLATRQIPKERLSAALADVPMPLERRLPGAALAACADEPARRAVRLLRFLGFRP